MSTPLIKPNYLVILPPTQHHSRGSFFRNLPPLFVFGIMTDLFWLNVRTIFTLASQAATVDLCGFDEISENYPVSFVFSSLNS